MKSLNARELAPALLSGVAIEVGLRVLTLPTLALLLGISLNTGAGLTTLCPPTQLGAQDARRYRSAQRVVRLWPDGGTHSCLRLALLAGFLLRHRNPALHLGAAHVGGKTCAHAWISIDGMVFDRLASTYRPLTEPAG